jgi:hypothetical protein
VQKLALLAPEGELARHGARGGGERGALRPYARPRRCSGDTARYLRVHRGLRGEGEAPTFLLFTLSSALFALAAPGGWVSKRCSACWSSAEALPGARRLRAPSRTPPRSTAPSRASAAASRGDSPSRLELHAAARR